MFTLKYLHALLMWMICSNDQKIPFTPISQPVWQLMNLRRHSLTERTSRRRTATCRHWLTVSKIKSYVIFHLGGLAATRSNLSQCRLWSENSSSRNRAQEEKVSERLAFVHCGVAYSWLLVLCLVCYERCLSSCH